MSFARPRTAVSSSSSSRPGTAAGARASRPGTALPLTGISEARARAAKVRVPRVGSKAKKTVASSGSSSFVDESLFGEPSNKPARDWKAFEPPWNPPKEKKSRAKKGATGAGRMSYKTHELPREPSTLQGADKRQAKTATITTEENARRPPRLNYKPANTILNPKPLRATPLASSSNHKVSAPWGRGPPVVFTSNPRYRPNAPFDTTKGRSFW